MKDEALYRDFQLGTMKVVYDDMYPTLMSYAMRLLGSDYSFLAEDCVQDSIYRTYLNRKSIPNTSQLKSYLYTSVRNKAISILRKGNSKKQFIKVADLSESDITSNIIEQETQRILFTAINKLPEPYRQIMEMSFEEGLKNAEIAKRLGISESAVKQRKAKMLEKLRRSLTNKEQFQEIIIFLMMSGFFR